MTILSKLEVFQQETSFSGERYMFLILMLGTKSSVTRMGNTPNPSSLDSKFKFFHQHQK